MTSTTPAIAELEARCWQAEELLRQERLAHAERVKELNCFYGLADLLRHLDTEEAILQGTVRLIPPAWQYPETAAARAVLENREYKTEHFRETDWMQSSHITISGEPAGRIEVCYLDQRPPSDEGPFLAEERRLLDAIAGLLGWVLEGLRAGETLRKSQARFREFFDWEPNYCYMISPSGTILDANPAALRGLGYTREELLGKPLLTTVYPPAARERAAQLFARWKETGRLDGEEIAIVTKSGAERTVLLHASVVRDDDGQLLHSVSIQTDITARKQTEEAHNLQALVLQQIRDCVTITDLDGTITYVNDAECRLMKRPREALIGQSVQSYGEDPARGATQRQIIDQTLAQEEWRGEVVNRAADGTQVILDCRTQVVRDKAGQPVAMCGIATDITGRKRVEEALRRSNQELQHFAYVVSHDLQEPLRMVRSYVQLLAQRYRGQLDSDADDFIAYAVDGADRMQAMIEGILGYSRVGTRGRELAPTDSEALLARVLASLQFAVAESGAQITHDPLPVVQADEVQLGQVFQNLLSNALKFRGPQPPHVHISAVPLTSPGGWRFSVCDDGIGVAPADFTRVFQMFARLPTRDTYPGTGIGLALCKRIVERHGGHIWVESVRGEGSTFYFTLPG